MPRRGRQVLGALVIAWALLLSGIAAATPRIGMVTMEPGEEYWARFGHNAVLVDDPARGEPILYNYGFFDFDEPGFLPRFLRGLMTYRLLALPASQDLPNYAAEGRGVTVQWLDIAPPRAAELATFLAWNARPENARYRYDYFTDNCSTRVRDAIDRALGGALKTQLVRSSQGLTYRSESLRLGAPLPWMALGMHLGLGPFADRPLSRWDEAFVPARLRDSLRGVRTTAGTPLVLAEQIVLPHRLAPTPEQPPRWRRGFVLTGLGLAILVLVSARRAPRTLAGAVLMFWTVAGLIGAGLTALWAVTDHVAAWGNENILLLSPLCLGLLPGAWAQLRRRTPPRWFSSLLLIVLLLAGVAGFLKFLPFRIQDNLDWIMLLLPLHAALWWSLRRRD